MTPDEAVSRLRRLPFADLGDALVDHHRSLRQGMPEAVYGAGKSPEQCARIVGELLAHGSGPVLLTRADDDQAKAVTAAHGPGLQAGRCILWREPDAGDGPRVVVVTAGTADIPVADECALTLRAYGLAADRLHDVGVAGLHRLLAHHDRIVSADGVVVIAGMEGALASVVGGLTAAPVVAVPTSAGYGSSFEGVTALLSMLVSCASGVDRRRHRQRLRCRRGDGTDAAGPNVDGRSVNDAWFNCAAGVAGDMLLASLVDAGADADAVAATVAGLGIDGWALAFERVKRGSITALYANVATDSSSEHSHGGEDGHRERTITSTVRWPRSSPCSTTPTFPNACVTRACAVFSTLAARRGRRCTASTRPTSSCTRSGRSTRSSTSSAYAPRSSRSASSASRRVRSASAHGSVSTAHGRLPTPAPAVARLLAARQIPVNGCRHSLEIATPTGVAVLAALCRRASDRRRR